jgi:hypothetical protein
MVRFVTPVFDYMHVLHKDKCRRMVPLSEDVSDLFSMISHEDSEEGNTLN